MKNAETITIRTQSGTVLLVRGTMLEGQLDDVMPSGNTTYVLVASAGDKRRGV